MQLVPIPDTDPVKAYWQTFDTNIQRRAEYSALVEAVLNCHPDDRLLYLETILEELRPGWPQAFCIDLMDEANWWADNSTRAERKAYMWATWQKLCTKDQASFLQYLKGRNAA